MKHIHSTPQCPCCGKRDSKVILTKTPLNGFYDIVRRRHCQQCDHRWYTGQKHEQPLVGVQWANREIHDTYLAVAAND